MFSPVSVCSLADCIVSRITQKLLNAFLRDLDGGWVSAMNRPH